MLRLEFDIKMYKILNFKYFDIFSDTKQYFSFGTDNGYENIASLRNEFVSYGLEYWIFAWDYGVDYGVKFCD